MQIRQEVRRLADEVEKDPREPTLPPGIPEEAIDAFEGRTGLLVPDPLREWLGFTNGPNIGPGGLYGIGTGRPFNDIEHYHRISPVWAERGWIPVAGDGFGNAFVLATRPEDSPGHPVFFIDPIWDRGRPRYVVASDLWLFLRSYFLKDLGERGWPCARDKVLATDPALEAYRTVVKCWEAE